MRSILVVLLLLCSLYLCCLQARSTSLRSLLKTSRVGRPLQVDGEDVEESLIGNTIGTSQLSKRKTLVGLLKRLRGGAKKKADSSSSSKKHTSAASKSSKSKKQIEEEEEAAAAEEEEEYSEEESEEGNEEDGEEGGNGLLDRMKAPNLHLFNIVTDLWKKTPPLTQIYISSSILFTTLSFMFNKNKWPDFLSFEWKPILTRFEFWRLYTGFLFFGALDLFYPLTLQFVWQHMSQLEKLSYKHPEEFFVSLLFGGGMLIALYSIFGISMKFLGHNLATYLVYIWSRVFEGADVNFMDILTLKAEMLPWFFCAQTFLLEQEFPFADLLGILVGHVYHYLKQKNVLKVPDVIKNYFDTPEVKALYAKFKDEFE